MWLHVAQAGRVQGRAQVVAHEVAFLFGAVDAAVPTLHGLGFVLHRHAPHRHAFGLVSADEAHKTLRPGGGVLRQQLAALGHLPVALHPRRWAPGRHQQLQRLAGHALRGADHRQQRLPVAVDVEVRQRHIARHLGVGVVAQAEVAAVHVHAAQRVALALGGVETVAQHGFLLGRRQRLPGGGRGLGEGTAKAQQGLEAALGVHVQAEAAWGHGGVVAGVQAAALQRCRGVAGGGVQHQGVGGRRGGHVRLKALSQGAASWSAWLGLSTRVGPGAWGDQRGACPARGLQALAKARQDSRTTSRGAGISGAGCSPANKASMLLATRRPCS